MGAQQRNNGRTRGRTSKYELREFIANVWRDVRQKHWGAMYCFWLCQAKVHCRMLNMAVLTYHSAFFTLVGSLLLRSDFVLSAECWLTRWPALSVTWRGTWLPLDGKPAAGAAERSCPRGGGRGVLIEFSTTICCIDGAKLWTLGNQISGFQPFWVSLWHHLLWTSLLWEFNGYFETEFAPSSTSYGSCCAHWEIYCPVRI